MQTVGSPALSPFLVSPIEIKVSKGKGGCPETIGASRTGGWRENGFPLYRRMAYNKKDPPWRHNEDSAGPR